MSFHSTKKQIFGLIGWFAVSFAAAAIGSAATFQAAPFYMHLIRPDWAPPPWLFGPVWTVLYTFMAVSAWLVWRASGFRRARTALTLFLIQLGFNALWSWLFFHWHRGILAFVEILLLWFIIAGTLFSFWRIRPLAGGLLVPYLLWVGFAAVLNYSLWQLNPHVLL